MNRSEYLKDRIELKRQKLHTISSRGWQQFVREILDEWEFKAYANWQTTPAEQTDTIMELQMLAKLSDQIRSWADTEPIINEVRGWEEALKEIEDGNAGDEWMAQAGPVQENPRMSLWRKIRERIGG